jgi:hypothetical protein
MGSTFVARRAGRYAASMVTAAMISTADTSVAAIRPKKESHIVPALDTLRLDIRPESTVRTMAAFQYLQKSLESDGRYSRQVNAGHNGLHMDLHQPPAPESRSGPQPRFDLSRIKIHSGVEEAFRGALFQNAGGDKPQASPPKTAPDAPPKNKPPCVPEFKSLEAVITGSIGVRKINGRCALMLGAEGKANGVTITSKVVVPEGCKGTLQYVQEIDMCITMSADKGKPIRRKTGDYWIDTQDPVDQQAVTSAGPVEFKTNDSPQQPVAKSVKEVHRGDKFKVWLMWQPEDGGGRVPLAITTWSWSGTADLKNADEEDCAKQWALTAHSSEGGKGKATKDSPAATKTVTRDDPPIEEGTCK